MCHSGEQKNSVIRSNGITPVGLLGKSCTLIRAVLLHAVNFHRFGLADQRNFAIAEVELYASPKLVLCDLIKNCNCVFQLGSSFCLANRGMRPSPWVKNRR